jgi:hypothetical protein
MGAVARSVLPPGWQSHMTQHGTGLQVIGFDPTSGMGWSLQPLYENETEPPLKLIVGCYLPPFQLRCMTDVLKLGARSVAQDLLGPSYEVKVSSTHVDKFDLLEFLISRARAAEIATADQASTPDSGAPVPRMRPSHPKGSVKREPRDRFEARLRCSEAGSNKVSGRPKVNSVKGARPSADLYGDRGSDTRNTVPVPF